MSAKFVNRDAACKFECICTDSAPLTVVSLKEGSLTWERKGKRGRESLIAQRKRGRESLIDRLGDGR